ncbi:hypothetical protein MIR68_001973 [Amoeboaphelidium protococcarum]|nr:hypothetical protein MIR68_001973 [Amoeboaphelidium protococcarum]
MSIASRGKGISIGKEDPEKLYQLIEQIGTGSYGEVFKGRQISTGEIVAVKIIKLEPGEELDEVLNEINFLQSCQHRNIVAYGGSYLKKGALRGEKQIWIAMEFCGGGSCEAIYKALKSPFNEKEISVIIRESLQGLAFLHSMRKLHRDIKSGNILLTDSGGVKLADFGVSTQLTKTFSKRNTFIGTPYWMSPETIQAQESGTFYDFKADIWSLGITCIEMAECSPPMFDMHPMRVLFMIPKVDPPTLRDRRKWSQNFHQFLQLCLQKDPDHRPNADVLLQHPFVASNPRGPAIVIDLIDRARTAKRDRKMTNQSSPRSFDSEEEEEEVHEAGSQAGTSGSMNPLPVGNNQQYSTMKRDDSIADQQASNNNLARDNMPEITGTMRPTTAMSILQQNKSMSSSSQQQPQIQSKSPAQQVAVSQSPDSPLNQNYSERKLHSRNPSASNNQLDLDLKAMQLQDERRELNSTPFQQSSYMHDYEGGSSMMHGQNSPNSAPAPPAPLVNLSQRSNKYPSASNLSEQAAAEQQRLQNTSSPSLSRHGQSQSQIKISPNIKPPGFKAVRLCRLTRRVNCAQYMGDLLLLGLEEGLFAFEADEGKQPQYAKMIPLSPRKYEQIDYIPEIGPLLISKSGKKASACIHDVKNIDKQKIAKRFEVETKVIKLKNASDIEYFVVSRVRADIYLSISKGKVATVMKWAPQPLWKFMKVRDFTFEAKPVSLDIVESLKSEAKLFVALPRATFKLVHLTSGFVEDLVFPSDYGKALKALDIGNNTGLVLLCFEFYGILASSDAPQDELKKFTWRSPLTFATKLQTFPSAQSPMQSNDLSSSSQFQQSSHLSRQSSQSSLAAAAAKQGGVLNTNVLIVAGSLSNVDIWSLDSGRIVHIFETKKDRIKNISLLLVKNSCKLYLLANEEKDGQRLSSVIVVYQEGIEQYLQQRDKMQLQSQQSFSSIPSSTTNG